MPHTPSTLPIKRQRERLPSKEDVEGGRTKGTGLTITKIRHFLSKLVEVKEVLSSDTLNIRK